MKYLSALLTDARASIGGATASKNRAGNYFRARIAPVQPRTPAQQAVRAQLSTLSAQWRGLTQAQIAAWNAVASQVVRKDTLGNSYSPTGEQLYVGNNQNAINIGASAVTDPPASPPTFPGPIIIGATATAGTPTFAVTTALAAAPTGFTFLLRATPQLSPGISFVGTSRFRVLDHFAASTFASINILAAYNALFGDLVEGAVIGVSISLVEIASGFQNLRADTVITVAA
jgi:hypothetical protein